MPSVQTDTHIVVGRFGKTYGLKGWLRLSSETKPASNVLAYQPWLVKSVEGYKPIKITGSMMQSDILLVHVAGFDTPEDAKVLSGTFVFTLRERLPKLSSDEFYWADLEGLTVITTNQVTLGVVDYLMEAGACDVMVVKGDAEYLVPFDKQNVVKQVDLQQGKIVVDWDPNY